MLSSELAPRSPGRSQPYAVVAEQHGGAALGVIRRPRRQATLLRIRIASGRKTDPSLAYTRGQCNGFRLAPPVNLWRHSERCRTRKASPKYAGLFNLPLHCGGLSTEAVSIGRCFAESGPPFGNVVAINSGRIVGPTKRTDPTEWHVDWHGGRLRSLDPRDRPACLSSESSIALSRRAKMQRARQKSVILESGCSRRSPESSAEICVAWG